MRSRRKWAALFGLAITVVATVVGTSVAIAHERVDDNRVLQLSNGAILRDVQGQSNIDGFPEFVACNSPNVILRCEPSRQHALTIADETHSYSLMAEWKSVAPDDERLFAVRYGSTSGDPDEASALAALIMCYRSLGLLTCSPLDSDGGPPPSEVIAIYRVDG